MADSAGAKKAMKKWTDGERFEFLLRVVDQAGIKAPKFADIKMEGRTTRALENEWAKIKASAAKFREGGGGDDAGETVKPTAATPKKKAAADKGDGESVKKPKPTTPRKRKAPTKEPKLEPTPEVESDNKTPDGSEHDEEEE